MTIFDLFQLVGGSLLSVGYWPQITQILRTKSVKDINFGTCFLVFLGMVSIEFYALQLVMRGSGHMLLLTNSIGMSFRAVIVFLILKYRKYIPVNNAGPTSVSETI